ncbi:peptide-methionine (S)-S-oxide reductase [Pedobacter yulinensis]|uniref:Peptide methionine sulfoxide reductase MsrA n=1 Tax=Pedobacter yulinensis TaxID=2126353 RepID=A0A2T3HPT8_9SPHI|nr:peptide-methionine (S)-S-oxide reductase MsrA [Pedobacter yulinensis]PST84475.1 peptide-methionine (S)-S-oxide reductase [Pedobacter yulinensis]
MQTAIFGGGCFWCTEAIFQTLRGVELVSPGYMGGYTPHPTYMEICQGDTGHAEVIKIDFDESVIGYSDLLQVFFNTHNPTTRNRQGNDRGAQYRSVVFYQDAAQRDMAAAMIGQVAASGMYEKEIVTELAHAAAFYPAETYHQDYFIKNRHKPYCSFVIQPKLDKFTVAFGQLLRPEFLEK